jgi:hypothetical protein
VANAHGIVILLLLPVFIVAGAGCRAKGENSGNRETSHVRVLADLHALATSRLGHIPHDEQEFKKFIATRSKLVEKLKIGSIDELFVSERDGQPLHVVYGTPPTTSDVAVYEQTGVNGKRLVGHRIGMVEEVDEAEYKNLTASKH